MLLAVIVLGTVGVAGAVALLVVVVGTFLPRVPVVGFLGSFLSGQYPVHVLPASLLEVGAGLGLAALGAPGFGAVVAAVGGVAFLGGCVVLAALSRTARAEGVRLDGRLALTALDQSGAPPDATVRYRPGLDLDLWLPPGPGPHPVMVWVHGGSWVRGARTDRARSNRWFAEHGLAVVSVQYRLPGDAPLPGATLGEAQRDDVATALAWVRGAGPDHGLDAAAVTLAGQSAGATLALTTAAALAGVPGATLAGGTPTPPPAATVAFYPVVDLRLVAPGLQDAVFGAPARTVPALARAASPTDLVAATLPPTMLVVGAADNFIRADLVRAHDAALRAAGVPGRLLQVPFADHVFDRPYGSPGGQIARPAVLAFVRERAWTTTPHP
ncbi:alpha/beta hydrolase [Actinomycetospora sp. TBRC 11914]|uniref:alpha/beta hydrolase n=1 Tax=Actinomycetospora sp. TBRC 11914 TaxID=2729387 RepID=UPI00145F2877|nr:alpha/beta hydrolase [Actinomycetospora sp. TBRC 11914]NMO91103.1 alpha/beta hydrolase [Actinomycetospora sp. TBRC 11914]